jgi:hypothetical protein
MALPCPHCGRVLEFLGDPPAFCGYCGHRLVLTPTSDLDAGAETVAPPARGEPVDVPEQVGGYRILRRLGAGAMGEVYEAEEMTCGRHVALKLIAPEFAASAETVERFRQEGRLASAIAHPRCVFVLAADEDAGRPYIVMELMPGDTLETLVERQGPLPPEEAVARILDVIDGLREAHRLGVVHRDVKPSNCFLEQDGRVKVGDFGLAKSLLDNTRLTRTGTFLGTLLFAAPEQVRAGRVDQQSDVYAAAATLYYLLTGQAPFQGGDAAATLARIVSDPAPSLRGRRPDLPATLDQVVLRGLERDRQRRWRNLEDFRAALLPFAPGRLSIGGVGLRFGAYLLDALVLVPLMLADWIQMQYTAAPGNLTVFRAIESFYLLLLLLYYGVPEGLWGWTLGKRWLRLRVWKVDRCDPPGLLRGLVRAGIWLTLLTLPGEISVFLFDPTAISQNSTFALQGFGIQIIIFCLGLVLILSTMRARNGYRCLHDFLTGTRVVCLPEPERGWHVAGRRLDEELVSAEGIPGQLGGFAVRGILRDTAGEQVLLGEDPALGRQVLLWLRPTDEPALDAARRDVTRPTRLRWLAEGHHPPGQWDAFLAPGGSSLRDLVAARGPLSWPETRAVLEQLAGELVTASAGGSLPRRLDVGQVWVREDGQVILLDMPLGNTSSRPTASSEPDRVQEEAIALLGEVAVLALEGSPRPRDAPPGPVRAPVPRHAARILQQLLQGSAGPYRGVEQVQADLAATHHRPAVVSRPRRAAHLALLAAFLGSGLLFLLIGRGTSTIVATPDRLQQMHKLQYVYQDLQEGTCREFVAAALTPEPAARLAVLTQAALQAESDLDLAEQVAQRYQREDSAYNARVQALSLPIRELARFALEPVWESESWTMLRAEREKQLRVRPQFYLQDFRMGAEWEAAQEEATEANLAADLALAEIGTGFVVACLILLVLWAFLLRGGLSFRFLGLSLVRGDGRPAARWQCAVRALLVWVPVTALLVASIWLEQQYWATWEAGHPSAWLLGLAHVTTWSAWALLPLYVGLALWRPTRAVHDRLSGTYLVPR